MPTRSASLKAFSPGPKLVISTTLPPATEHRDVLHDALSPASPEESDDPPLSPMVFQPNDDYEKNRLSVYVPPALRAVSSPSSPNDSEESSPIIFSHPNLSSPSLILPPLPVFPSSHSLAVRSRRPLPPLPNVFIADTAGAVRTASPQALPRLFWNGGRMSPISSDVDDHDSDSLTVFSSPTRSSSSQSPSTSVYTTASSEPPDSAKRVDGSPRAEPKPRPHGLTVATRSYSAPLPSQQMSVSLADRFASPHISVTPASPPPPKQFSFYPTGKKRTRTASATSIVMVSDPEDDLDSHYRPLSRAVSPTPSLTPSVSSTKSVSKPQSTLKRIASKTRLFGRRQMSTSSDPWADDDDDTVVGHGAYSLEDKSVRTRARSESPLGCNDTPQRPADCVPRALRRVEIAEVTLTPHGDVWQERDLDEVIPKLRQLRAPTRIKI
ncbi:hypothetical protein C2E23DRAFT_857763 [Lenzites betulinus]|nr:hypothetical protein C2E23DRAFT_857763 [Lenzites betulinus]